VRHQQRADRLLQPRHLLRQLDQRHREVARAVQDGEAERADQHEVAGGGVTLLPEQHTPAHGGTEGKGREAVQRGLEHQALVVAGQAVLDRTQDGEWTDAEQQAGGDERLAQPAAFHGEAPLQRHAQTIERALDVQRLADQCPEENPRQDIERVLCLLAVQDPKQQRGQPEALQDRVLEALR
jgi:hypothetical protein